MSHSARSTPRVLVASRSSTDGDGAVVAATDGRIPEGVPGAPATADVAMEGAQKFGRFVSSTAGAAVSGELTAQAAADAAGEAAAAVTEKAKAFGGKQLTDQIVN